MLTTIILGIVAKANTMNVEEKSSFLEKLENLLLENDLMIPLSSDEVLKFLREKTAIEQDLLSKEFLEND